MERLLRSTAALVLCVAPMVSLLSCSEQTRLASARRAAFREASAASDAPMASGELAARKSRVSAEFVNFQQPADATRRIIYEAELGLVVKDVPVTETQISTLLKQFNGYVAESTIDRTQGEQLTGRWRVRIPVEHFDAFLDSVSKLGVAENRHQTAQDVTEEFVDLEAQISNKKRLEERIIKLLEDKSGEIKDVIEVERELGRVRGEIEQMEGRLRFLTNRTELTTVSIVAREVQDYVPPQAPTFVNRIRQAWADSVKALRVFGEQAAVAAVYAFPWLSVLGVLFFPARWYARRLKSNARDRAANSTPN